MHAHIGLNHLNGTGLVWLDGTAVSYNGFVNNTAPMYMAGKECVVLSSDMTWRSVNCDCGEMTNTMCDNVTYGYVCRRDDGKFLYVKILFIVFIK